MIANLGVVITLFSMYWSSKTRHRHPAHTQRLRNRLLHTALADRCALILALSSVDGPDMCYGIEDCPTFAFTLTSRSTGQRAWYAVRTLPG